jgi:hypothetical protein
MCPCNGRRMFDTLSLVGALQCTCRSCLLCYLGARQGWSVYSWPLLVGDTLRPPVPEVYKLVVACFYGKKVAESNTEASVAR